MATQDVFVVVKLDAFVGEGTRVVEQELSTAFAFPVRMLGPQVILGCGTARNVTIE
jgi:hypothetical protein